MSTPHDIPNYHENTKTKLFAIETRLALDIEAAENRGDEARALLLEERYCHAFVARLDQTEPTDETSAKRMLKTRADYLKRAAECRRERLGLSEAVLA
ncbi:hypothetical protein [Modicisalibacter luteus]|uniref:Uncharacterized protein n=1 Tax=Modicisalibacter luteus TaxID=453962 RepID=A0ABV7M3R8_9GAMM|nr:hypothetical protein [Halomonas lutea]GHA85231.1 hypothetical protein GCM10007159_02890 [Halomonas lutea]